MPHLREWQLHHPSRWTQAQAEAYIVDTSAALTVGMSPVTLAMGPLVACNILLSVMFHIARANPVWVDRIMESMAETSEQMMTIMPKGTVQ